MKALLQRIRQILRERRVRKFFTRFVSTIAAIVVFVTTYALILPAITLEKVTACGIEEHQHDMSCYEDVLTCGLEESDGHRHDDSCYKVVRDLICEIHEHQHGEECYDENGELTCTLAEHTHGENCYKKHRELTCGIPESEGHHHDASCYKKVLTCDKEVHVHSTACYHSDAESETSAEDAATAGTKSSVAAGAGTASTAGGTANADASDGAADASSVGSSDASTGAADGKTGRDAGESNSGTESVNGGRAGGSDGSTGSDASAAATTNVMPEEVKEKLSDGYVPQLDPVDMEAVLGKNTGFYYYDASAAAENGQDVPADSSQITDWKKYKDDDVLEAADILRLYLPYTIPAGTLNSTNQIARYRLPGNIRLDDAQIIAINGTENGLAGSFVNYDTLEITDPDKYEYYRGAEAVEGTRKPDQDANDYLYDLVKHGGSGEEYISAVVKAENVFDEKTEDYLGQDLIFIFTPYSIEKNQNEYDTTGKPVKAGEKITGWFACDFNCSQINWTDADDTDDADEDKTETSEKTADVVLVNENKDAGIKEISETLILADRGADLENGQADAAATDIAVDDAAEAKTEAAAEEAPDAAVDVDDALDNQNKENKDAAQSSGTAETAEEASNKEEENKDTEYKSGTLTATGDSYKVTLDYTAEAKIPEEARLQVTEITAESDPEAHEACLEEARKQVVADDNVKATVDAAATRFFDIEIVVEEEGQQKKIEPSAPVAVNIQLAEKKDTDKEEDSKGRENTGEDNKGKSNSDAASAAKSTDSTQDPTVLHFTEEGVEHIEAETSVNETKKDVATEIQFETESFSIYGVVYTVDFEYSVNGKMYQFSLPGGGFVSFTDLVEVLGIIDDTNAGENEDENGSVITENAEENAVEIVGTVDENATNEEAEENGLHSDTNTSLTLGDVVVSDASKKFVADVASVEFSNPELVDVSKVDADTTVGQIKESRGLEVEYSAELTEEQIAEINAKEVKADDWALISVRPFASEETLTVTMKNGEQFVVRMTDAQISTHVMTADGKDYVITVTYGPEAGIPDGAVLHAAEITREKNEEEFKTYTETAEELLSSDIRDFIRIFDISIMKDGVEVEPKAPVSVCIEYTKGVELLPDSLMKVVHFASAGAEVLENHTEETEGVLNKVTFETDSFSAYATISERLGDALAAKCIAYFSFDDDASGFTGSGATAARVGTTQLRDGYSERALYLEGNGNLNVTKNNGSSLLTGLDEFTVSYWAYPDQSQIGEWAYFIAPNTNGQSYAREQYLGTFHNYGTITAERYNNTGSRPDSATVSTSLNEWHHVAVVYKNGATELYLDGKLADSENSSVQIRNLLGGNSIFQIGKGNWGSGEYYHGYLDEFAVFNSALTAEEVAKVCDNAYYHDAKKVSVTDLRDGQSVIIYNKIWNNSTKKYDYYAVVGDGTLAPVYDVSDTIYWRHDSSLEWKLIVYYQTERDANGNPVTDEDGNPVYVLDEHGEKIESGYYEFYNEATGKYLAPQSGSWSADAPFGVNLEGRRNSQYASTIESWDPSANQYYGYRYDKDGTGNAVLNTASSTETSEHRDWEFFFATTEILKEGELETVETVTNPNGLTIKMQNFPGTGSGKDRTDYLQSVLGGTYHPGATQNILEDVIQNGWPYVSGGNGKNLGQIYNDQKTVDGLFIQSIYDESGYYEYSSFNNYAYLGDQDRFTVYKQIGTPSSETQENRFYWKRGNFFPYNAISSDNISVNKNYYDENGNLLDKNDPRYGETLYRTVAPSNLNDSTNHANDTKKIADFYFGMTIDANFMMPAGGRDDRNSPVTFEFNGDDDMWVYIDGVLVLDLGGIHDARAGKIDFESGQITYAFPSENSRPTTIKGCFERAGVLPNGDPWDANRVDEFFSGNTFKDYSTHTMNMYYMERGAGASNLHVKFNLPIVEEGKFTVEKKLEGANGEYANQKFAYKAYRVQNVQGQDRESVINPSSDAGITCVYEGTNTPVPFDADGTFYLKAGEKAVFSVGDQMIRYYVKEVGVDPDDFDVYFNNDANPAALVNGEVSSTVDTVQNRAHLLYRNKAKKPGLLHITKKVFSPDPITDDPRFEFYVYLENTDGEIVPYKNGKYYVTKKTETGWDYYEYANGSLVRTADQTKPVSYEAGPYGAIGNIPDGYTIEVKDLLPGTHFLVTERLDRIPEGYSYYGKTLTADTYDAVATDAKYSGTAPDGRIKESTAADVIVTNVTQDFGILKDLEIRKIWKGDNAHPEEITFTVQATI